MGQRGPLRVVRSGGLKAVGAQPDSVASTVQAIAPDKPTCISEDAALSALWDDIVPGLDSAGLASRADTAAIAACLMHFNLAHMAYREVVESGSVATAIDEENDRYGMKKHPSEQVFRLESREFLGYAQQLGMTWMSRARTAIPKGDNESGNPFESRSAASG